MPKSPILRFAAMIKKVGECWIWVGTVRGNYGSFWDGKKNVAAHRWSYEYHKKKITKGKVICHSCDNPLCVNPAHLVQGTQTKNMRDAARRGRIKTNKLSRGDRERIAESRLSNRELAEEYGVWPSTISRARKTAIAKAANGL